MKDSVVKRGARWSYIIELGEESARHCPGTPNRNSKVRRHRVWIDEHAGDECPQCGQPLGPVTTERRQKWVSGFATKKDAVADRRRKLGILHDEHGDPFPESITLRAFLHERLVPHWKTQGRPREVTWRRYVELLDRWIVPEIGGVDIAKLGPRHVQAALDKVIAAGKAPATVAQVRAAVSVVFSQALRWQVVRVSPVPATQTPTVRKPDLTVPTPEQIRALIASADTPAKPGAATTWAIPVLIAGVTGARRSEVLAVRWQHVDLDAGTVRIVAALACHDDGTFTFEPPKTKAAVRTVPISAFAVERLRRHRVEQAQRRLGLGAEWADHDLVCEAGSGRALSPDAFSQAFKRLAKRAGLEGVRLHDLRHGVATELARRLRRAQLTAMVLGHSNVSFTAETYVHPDETDLARIDAALNDAFGGAV